MKIILGRKWSISSLAIRLFTWSNWSHVAAILEDGNTIIESTAKEGVRLSTLSQFKKEYPDYLVVDLPATKGWENRLRKHLYKPYDWAAIFDFVFRTEWQSPSKWVCSELIAAECGYINSRFTRRITPQHLLMFSKEL